MIGKKLAVIKLGGHAMDDEPLLQAFLGDVSTLLSSGWQFVIVHGGGPHINALLQRLNIKSEFVNGLRVTDAETLTAVEMALCAQVNKDITRRLLKTGVNAVGICGQDNAMLRAEVKDRALGLVGRVTEVNPQLPQTLLAADILPVVAPLALGPDFQPLNVNADTAAGAIAGAMGAAFFVLLSDVPGVLGEEGQLLRRLNGLEIERLRREAIITGGMIPKVECCQTALASGCASALILDGRQEHALANYLTRNAPQGTEITA